MCDWVRKKFFTNTHIHNRDYLWASASKNDIFFLFINFYSLNQSLNTHSYTHTHTHLTDRV